MNDTELISFVKAQRKLKITCWALNKYIKRYNIYVTVETLPLGREKLKTHVFDLFQQGWNKSKIARHFNISWEYVNRLLNEIETASGEGSKNKVRLIRQIDVDFIASKIKKK